MKKTAVLAAAVAALGLISGEALAQQQSPWQVRVRAVDIEPSASDSAGAGLGVSSKLIPEFDVSYFFTKNIAAELILTVPQKHDVTAGGKTIGSFKHLPPTLTLQYHFAPDNVLSPYVGAGVNYTRISDVNLGGPTLDSHSFGLALQAGVDYKINKNWSLNFDVKKVKIATDVYAAGARVNSLKVDPLLVGIGVGYRF
jgi:outer membrane protein